MEFIIGQPTLIAECVLGDEAVIHQEVCFYYEVDWPAGVPRSIVHKNAADQHRFAWVPVDELQAMKFMPMEISGEIASAGSGLRHLFFDRRHSSAATGADPVPSSGPSGLSSGAAAQNGKVDVP
ncbi:hypothetical protein SALBM311S_09820 [Streptomyces alboniger]